MSEVFRAWDKKKNQYINSFVVNMNGSVYYDTEYSEGKADAILERATGLEDKHGRMIFEGDIINIRNQIPSISMCRVIFYRWAFKLKNVYEFSAPERITPFHFLVEDEVIRPFEIIGNIHENKELLGEGG